MTEEQEVFLLLKELVDRMKRLEEVVYNNDNLLMKSGLVAIESPRPGMAISGSEMPTSDQISKMDWGDITELVSKLEGGQGNA